MAGFLIAFLLAVLAAECTRVLERPARVLVKCAVRLSHGRTPRAVIRLHEETGNLQDCAGQIGKLGFAIRLTGRGLAERVGRTIGLPYPLSGANVRETQVCRAAAEAVGRFFHGIDLRVLGPGRRREAADMMARLRDLLRNDAFDEDGSARLLAVVASLSESLIADRNEPAALSLIGDAQSHVARLGRCHPVVFAVRRAHGSALCELGQYQQAEALLKGLIADERQISEPGEGPMLATQQIFAWALEGQGRHAEAEAYLKAVRTSLLRAPGADPVQLRHVECKISWVVGQQHGRTEEAAEGYDRVIANRSRELAPDHPDCLDAEHSKGKMLVRNCGDGPRALAILEPLLVKRTRVQGTVDSDTLETRKYVAVARVLNEPFDVCARRQAVRDLRRILRIQAERHGSQYPMTADTAAWLKVLAEFPER